MEPKAKKSSDGELKTVKKRKIQRFEDISHGKPMTKIEFKLQDLEMIRNRVIFAGLFPPKNAHEDYQHDNRTSRNIANRFGHFDFDWIDIFPYSPDSKSSDVDGLNLKNYVAQNPHFGKEWYNKIMMYTLKFNNFKPIIYICGQICKDEWKKVTNDERKIHPILELYELKNCIIFYGQHPSAHLQAHGKDEIVAIYYRNMYIINFLLKNNGILHGIDNFISESEHKRYQKQVEYCNHKWKTDDFPNSYLHLKHLPFENEFFFDRLSCSREDFLKNPSFTLRLIDDNFWSAISFYDSDFFMCTAFCVRITDIRFQERMKEVNQLVGTTMYKKLFKSEGFCVHILDDKLFSLLKTYLQDKDILPLFISSTFCAYILESAHLNIFYKYCNFKDLLTLFSKCGFCSNIKELDFQSLFDFFLNDRIPNVVLTRKNSIKLFATNAFCKNILNINFFQIFNDIFLKYGEQITIDLFTTNGFSENILDINFYKLFISELSEKGFDQYSIIKLFSSNGFTTHILNPGFLRIIEEMVAQHDTWLTNLVKLFMCDGFCAKLESKYFRDIFQSIIESFPDEIFHIMRMFSKSSFCRHLQDNTDAIQFHQEFLKCTMKLGIVKTTKLFSTQSFCAHLVTKGFFEFLSYCQDKYPQTYLSLFSKEGFCSQVGKKVNNVLFEDMFKISIQDSADYLHLFRNEIVCRNILKTEYYNWVKNLFVQYPKFANLIYISSSFAKRLELNDQMFLNNVQDDYDYFLTFFCEKDFFRIYGWNSYYVEHNESGKLIRDKILKYFPQKHKMLKLLKYDSFVKNIFSEGISENFCASIDIWKRKCGNKDIYSLFLCSHFISNATKPEFQDKFDKLVQRCTKYETYISALELAISFFSVSTFNTKYQNQEMILQYFDQYLDTYFTEETKGWLDIMVLFTCSTFIGRIEKDYYRMFFETKLNENINNAVLMFSNDSFNQEFFPHISSGVYSDFSEGVGKLIDDHKGNIYAMLDMLDIEKESRLKYFHFLK